MSKITVASVFVAVCILQTAYAGLLDNLPKLGSERNAVLDGVNNLGNGLLDKLPLNSVYENVHNQVSNTVKTLGNQLKVKYAASQDALLNSEACIDLKSEGEQAVSQLASNFKSCLSQETQSAGQDYQELINIANTVEASVTSTLGNLVQCYENNSNPAEIFQCVYNALQGAIPQVVSLINNAAKVALDIPSIFVSLRTCYESAFLQAVGPAAYNLVANGQQCVRNVVKAVQSS
ncbi:hypothetical protein PUN28_017129 [Cardiocondyla obscurior]|uniref:Uncharacterized protein n=1 Tax=Cardiocondyla obscurior TaxID=286306 RepID=A0AAW2EM33_9HYME